MTEERNKPDLDGEVDSLVTQTYKEISSERAPEHLDKAILKQAAGEARPRYLRSVSWTRPIAWAATITLCVGLVLEITKAPVPVSTEIALPPGRIEAPASTMIESEVAPAKADAPQTMIDEERSAPVERKRAAKKGADLRQQKEKMPASAEVFSLQEEDLLDRAEGIATLRSDDAGYVGKSDQTSRNAEIIVTAPALALPACSEAEIATAESWLRCIERLEEAGREAQANEQRALYDAAFPVNEPL